MAANPDSVFQSLDNGNSPLELLMIGSSPEEAARCATALRNSGQSVRLESTETPDGLLRLLETVPADLVTINADCTTLPPGQAIEMIRHENPAASIILLSEKPPKWAKFASEMQLRDLLHSISTGRLIFAIQREYQTLLLRQELARTRTHLENAEARFNKLLSSSRDAVAYIHEGMHIQSNPVYRELFGLSPEDMDDLTMMDLVAQDDRDKFKKALKKARRIDHTAQNILFQCHAGGTFRADMELSPTEVNGEICVQVIIRPESSEEGLQTKLNELIDRDPQTHLLHRHAFVRSLETIQAGGGIPDDGLLMGINIDNFVKLSNSEGIEAADCLLEKSAELLRGYFGNALLSRFGDHEFLAFMRTDTPPDDVAAACLNTLHQGELGTRCNLSEEPEFSLGLLPTAHAGDLTVHELIRRCRRTIHRAGEEREPSNEPISVFGEADLSAFDAPEADSEIVGLIDGALEHDRFRLLYQPIVSLEGDTRENYSIFVRLLDSGGTEREPSWFYPHADQAERLAEIDRWVIRQAIRELAQHRANGRKINFHITLSRAGALDDSMLLWVCDCLREFRAKGAWLYFQFELELLTEQPPALIKLVEGLLKINCKISCNAIPGNFNDFPLLARYRIALARFSPGLSTDLASSRNHQKPVAALNTALQERGIKTVATGVENANTLAVLWNIGVNYVQGYFLQTPTPSIELEDA